VIDHATARHNARRKIVREDSDGRRLIIELEQIVVHACWELLISSEFEIRILTTIYIDDIL
jgi:hypothetical protein